jgi:peptidoglycan hydrolase-like protein with peptidoglycan-binding domain
MVISAEEIKRAQEALKSRGYDPGAISGRMHAKTQDALREFQKNNNLTPTGVLDKKTADRLDVLVPDQSGSADPGRTR